MSKLRWHTAKTSICDPARVISPPGETIIDRWVPPAEKARRAHAKKLENERLLKRSEKIRFKSMIKKYGEARAILLGVPKAFINAMLLDKDRARARQEKATAKKERRAKRKAETGE